MSVKYMNYLSKVKAEINSQMENRVVKAAEYFRDKVKEKLSQPGHGRWYYIMGRWHRASAPGEPPAKLTGALRNSIEVVTQIHRDGTINAGVQTTLDKAGKLEYGDGARLLPRPFFKPTYLREKAQMIRIMGGNG